MKARLQGNSNTHTYGNILGEIKSTNMIYGNKLQHFNIYGYSSETLWIIPMAIVSWKNLNF